MTCSRVLGILAAVNLEKSTEHAEREVLPDHELRDLLESAERRKEADLQRKGRTVSIIVMVPLAVLVFAAAVFLIRYQAAAPPVAVKPVVAAPPQPLQGADLEADAAFDSFRPKAFRVNKPDKAEPTPQPAGKIIDKSDIEFATRLLNFGNAADTPPPKH